VSVPNHRVRIVVTPHFVVRPEQLARLAQAHPHAEVVFATTPAEFAAALPDCDGAITGFPLAPDLLARASRLRWLQTQGAGVERLLTPELIAAPLTITATKGPMNILMAEHALALLLALARQLPAFVRDQQQRRWRRYPAERGPLVSLVGKTLLVLGVGGVGGEVARMAKLAFGMRVLGVMRTQRDHAYIDASIDPTTWQAALSQADAVSLSLPLTPATAGIIDAAALAAMKLGAFLINVARGQLVDEAALVAALAEGRLGGAGLDATAVEPLPADSRLWELPNVLITPHTSAITDDLGERFVAFWAENIGRFVEDQPLRGLVDKQAGY
jgi:phosphoglycerate dehydrogenase-like enzyme